MAVAAQPTNLERIEIASTRSEISEIASYLQDHLGQRITAYLSGLKDPKVVGQWTSGKIRPRNLSCLRLRHAYQAARRFNDPERQLQTLYYA